MSTRTVGIIGAGNMGRGLVRRLAKAGRRVMVADQHADRAEQVAAEAGADQPGTASGVPEEQALAADIVVLALWYPATIEFATANQSALAGKIVVDISNPLDESFTGLSLPPTTSGAEELAAALPNSRVVKAFNTVPAPTLFTGEVGGTTLDTFVAADDADAKAAVMDLLRDSGLRGLDAGALANSRLLERLTAFGIELGQRYGLGFDFGVKYLPTTDLSVQALHIPGAEGHRQSRAHGRRPRQSGRARVSFSAAWMIRANRQRATKSLSRADRRCPGGGADLEGALGQLLSAMLAQLILTVGREGRQVRSGRADSERERLPPRIEPGLAHLDGQRGDLDRVQPGLREQFSQVTLADAGQVRLVVGAGIEFAHRPPEGAQRPAAARVVPDAGCDHAAGPGDPAHLPQARHRVGHEVHDQLRQHGVEGGIAERQLFGGGLPDVHTGQPLARRGHERRGRFHRAHRVRADPPHQFGRQRAWAASHIEYPLAAADRGQVGELCRERLGVPPHEPEVGIRADVKAHHANLPSPTGRRGCGPRHQPWLLPLAPGGAGGAQALS
jgi:8-hydroxy-5-deazaflavin:NADPH oxidoreductase